MTAKTEVPRRGRPLNSRKPAADCHTRVLTIRLTPAEHSQLTEMADREQLFIADLIRRRLFGDAKTNSGDA